MPTTVPTLGTSGWVKEIIEKADKLLAYFFVSEHSQSNLYRGTIASLPYLIQQYGNNPRRLQQETQERLTDYLSQYFEEVTLTATAKTIEDGGSKLDLRLEIEVKENGKSFSFGKLVQARDAIIQRIVDINNNG